MTTSPSDCRNFQKSFIGGSQRNESSYHSLAASSWEKGLVAVSSG
jgi:hypothetical protein